MDIVEVASLKKNVVNLSGLLREDNTGTLVKALDRLGRLDETFDTQPLLHLLKHNNERIRSLAVKNLAKLGNISLVNIFIKLIEEDKSSSVRREAVSAIGRMRNSSNKTLFRVGHISTSPR